VQDSSASVLPNLIFGERVATPAFDGPQDAVVVAAGPTSLTFIVTGVSGFEHTVYGPAPYPRAVMLPAGSPDTHIHAPAIPPSGTACVVVFVGNGIDRPRVLLLVGWP